jgi:iron complex outermembrane recepter protein
MIKEHVLFSFILIISMVLSKMAMAQTDTAKESSLPELQVRAFEQNRKLKETPAAINYINQSVLERFTPNSIVQAVNSTPGVRMEERSPGSYRFNIRGSSLRSPFGVRNVKIYYNDIPITDPGGHTYLNQLGYYNFKSIEIIKGPGSSLYGAGTGGVLLIEGMNPADKPSAFAEAAIGSYNMKNIYGSISVGSGSNLSTSGIQHQESNGYRNHSYLRRNVAAWNAHFKISDSNYLKTTFLYGDLFYETPGALTKAEYDLNPRAARPGNAFLPGAEQAAASVGQKMFIAGASYEQQLIPHWRNKSVLYGMFTELRNPTIQNYGRSSEPHFGSRTTFQYSHDMGASIFNMDIGAEVQQGLTSVSIFNNHNGTPDTLRSTDEINNRQAIAFVQVSLDSRSWIMTAGSSLNFLSVSFQRFNPAPIALQERTFTNQLAPRIAVLKKLRPLNIYVSVSKGFSPPSTAELLPTGGAINFNLNPEQGWNYEAGLKGTIRHLSVDINAFYFSLNNTIVQRRTAAGGDYFINAGRTKQNGIETYLSYPLFHNLKQFKNSSFWLSHTWHNFHYREFKQVSADYSGNLLPAEAKNTISAGLDFLHRSGVLGTISYYYSSKVPLNDANSEYADPYHIVGIKGGYQCWVNAKWRLKLFAGVDNLLDQKYSLGNDINGFGGRYYNAAAGRNYYISMVVQSLINHL